MCFYVYFFNFCFFHWLFVTCSFNCIESGRVGKTSLLLRYVHNVFFENQRPTVQASNLTKVVKVDEENVMLDLWVWFYFIELRLYLFFLGYSWTGKVAYFIFFFFFLYFIFQIWYTGTNLLSRSKRFILSNVVHSFFFSFISICHYLK
jgi:hypothetical protein